MNKTLKTIGLIIGPLVLISAAIGGIIETRVNLSVVQEDYQEVDQLTKEHEGKVKILERRADEMERLSERQVDALEGIKDYLNALRTEQMVQGQLLKGFIEEYRRKES